MPIPQLNYYCTSVWPNICHSERSEESFRVGPSGRGLSG